MSCTHLDTTPLDAWAVPVDVKGCPECIADGHSDWVHVRMCLTCGYVGCCDSSPRTHATRHYRETFHPVMRSIEPGEQWRWCYVDEQLA